MSWLDATADLLEAARAALRESVAPALDGAGRYEAAMVAKALTIGSRELQLGPQARAEEQALLAEFYDASATDLPELRRRLCRDLRARALAGERAAELERLLDRVVRTRLAISNPDYVHAETYK